MKGPNRNLKVVIDSAGDLPDGWSDTFAINVIPINIHFGEKTYLQGVDLTDSQFYHMAVTDQQFPKTSQPTPQQFIDYYRKIADQGDTIVSIHVTSKLSGTFSSAQIAARELNGEINVIPIDSASGSAAMGYMAREARLMANRGIPVDEIVEQIKKIASQVQIILTLKTLEFARRSGRVKALQAALASLLQVKPVIVLKSGVLEMGERVRTRRKALEYTVDAMAKRVGQQLVNVAVVHAEDPEAGESLLGYVQSRLNFREIIITKLSIGVAANLGPGTAGLVAYPVED
jgi:DegV family protein with EDD domain